MIPSIDWFELVQESLPGAGFGALFLMMLSRRSKWIRAVALATGAQPRSATTLNGSTDGVSWTLRLHYSIIASRPTWELRVPSVVTPSIVLRAEHRWDRLWKRLGTYREAQLGDPELDERHLVLASDEGAAREVLEDRAVRDAVLELDLGAHAEGEGNVRYVELGNGLSALVDLSRISVGAFALVLHDRVKRLVALAKALQGLRTGVRPWDERLSGAAVDPRPSIEIAILAAVLGLPMLSNGGDWLRLATGTLSGIPITRIMLGGLAGCSLLAFIRALPAWRRPSLFVPRLGQGLILSMLGPVLALDLCFALNGLASRDPKTIRTKVVEIDDSDDVVVYYKIKLDGIGKAAVSPLVAGGLEVGDEVEVRVVRGRLGWRRLTGLLPVKSP